MTINQSEETILCQIAKNLGLSYQELTNPIVEKPLSRRDKLHRAYVQGFLRRGRHTYCPSIGDRSSDIYRMAMKDLGVNIDQKTNQTNEEQLQKTAARKRILGKIVFRVDQAISKEMETPGFSDEIFDAACIRLSQGVAAGIDPEEWI